MIIQGKKITCGIIIIALLILVATPLIRAANDPGHDTLYIEQQGDSELNGSLNVTLNTTLKGGRAALITYLDIFYNGQTPGSAPSIPTITGTASNLYVDSPGGGILYLNRYAATGVVAVGDYASQTINLNVSGSLYVKGGATVNGQSVCLANGSNCPSILGGANITGSGTQNTIAKFTGTTSIGNSVITEINSANISIDSGVLFIDGTNNRIGIGTTSPNTTLHVAGRINVTTGNDICIDGGKCLSTTGTATGTVIWINFNTSGLLGGNISTSGSVDLNYTYLSILYYNNTNPLGFYNLTNITGLGLMNQTYANATYINLTTGSVIFNITSGANRLNLTSGLDYINRTTILNYATQTTSNATYLNITTGQNLINLSSGLSYVNLSTLLNYATQTTSNASYINLTTGSNKVGGTGTLGTVAYWTGTNTIGSDSFYHNATDNKVSINGTSASGITQALDVHGSINTTGMLYVSGNTTIDGNTLMVDATNNRVGIGTATPNSALQVAGNTNMSGYNVSTVNCIIFDTGGKICAG